ncbi:MAG: phosphatase PAP2 family protein [bacterium]|nr:phosphatase PAP2 family protein [bacterium]
MEFILWLQSFSTPLLDRIFATITAFGDEEFFMVAGALVLWLVDKRTGFWAVFMVIVSAWLNGWLKDVFGVPRPDPAIVRIIRPEPGLSFPSGHAQNTTVFWGCLALGFRRPRFAGLAAGVVLLVALSRPYLGVHYPVDVVGGIFVGLLLLAAFLTVGRRADLQGLPGKLGFAGQLACAVVLPLVLLLIFVGPDGIKLTGFLVGAAVGRVLELHLVRQSVRGTIPQQVARAILGLVVLFALRTALKAIFPDLAFFHFLRYSAMALWGVFLAPWCFVALRLAGREDRRVPPAITA